MRILFIYPDLITRNPSWQGYYYEGIAILSAVARQAGHETELLHVWQEVEPDDVVRWVQERSVPGATLVAFSATVGQFPYIRRWAPAIKEATGFPVLVGGVHATISAESVIATPGIDMICRGDGEAPLVELAARLETGRDPDGVPGIWYHDAEGRVVSQEMGPLTDLATLPPPDWDVFPTLEDVEWFRDGVGVHNGSRGCPYDCSFCSARTLMDATKGLGNYTRFKPVRQFVAELKVLREKHPNLWAFAFEDDIFGMKRPWLEEFAELYPREVGLPYGCNVRPNLVTPELIDLYVRSGCKQVHVGIDAGNDVIRNEILNRKLSRESIVTAFRLFHEAGIEARSYNIVGNPHETPEAILDTIKLNSEIAPKMVQSTIFFPYEGTRLHDLVVEEGTLAREVTCYFKDTSLEQESIRRDQVLMFNENFQFLVRHYQRLRRLPRPLRRAAEGLSDRFLVSRSAPRTLAMLDRLRGAWGGRPVDAASQRSLEFGS